MPVRKFRSLEEAERAQWFEPGDPRIWEAACRRWALHRALGRAAENPEHGVFRFATLEEKQRRTRG